MLLIDIILLLALLGAVGAGIKDGFVQTIGRLIGAVVGFVLARIWSVGSGMLRLVSFALIFIITTRLAGMAMKLVDGIFKILSFIPFLKSINSLLGAIAGFAEGIILIGGISYVNRTYVLEPHLVAWFSSSIVAQWIERVFRLLLGVLL